MEVASQKNNTPLPLVAEDKFGVRLPPDRYCLVNKNYVVLPSKRKRTATAVGPWDMYVLFFFSPNVSKLKLVLKKLYLPLPSHLVE